MKPATRARSGRGKGAGTLHVAPKGPNVTPTKTALVAPAGLAFGELETLRKQLELTMDQLTTRLGLTRATLQRRKATGRLTIDESARVVRFARLLGQAAHILGGVDEARKWLKTPQKSLGGATPLDRAQTEVGVREIEQQLEQLDPGPSA